MFDNTWSSSLTAFLLPRPIVYYMYHRLISYIVKPYGYHVTTKQLNSWWATSCPPYELFFGFRFSSPVRRLDQPQVSGDLGEHCSSPERHSREVELRSPACLRLIEGTRRAANRGRFLLVTFLGKTRKVTSCRAAPGEVALDFNLRK